MSPLFFNIYIADIIKDLNSDIFLFADDMSILKIIYNESDCITLQNDLTKVYEFCIENSLKLNPNKSEVLRISFKNTNEFNYKINNNVINNVSFHKHIGVIYDCKMSFNSHFDYIIQKALKKFAILRVFCKRVNGLTFLRMYTTYIRVLQFICNSQ